MRIAVIGRTGKLLAAARRLHGQGARIPVVWTCPPQDYEGTPPEAFAALARETGADYRLSPDLTAPEAQAALAAARCDVAISMGYLYRIPKAVRALFPHGILNCHGGDLPRYRGSACANWAILQGETSVALTVHQMADGIDAGPTLLKEYLPISDGTYIGDIMQWYEACAPDLLANAATGLLHGDITPQPQPAGPEQALRCYPRRPEDGRINWTASAEAICRLVRATSRPFAGAFSLYEGRERVTVWRARPHRPRQPFLAVPGHVCRVEGENPVVACGDSRQMVEIEEAGMEGKTPAEAKALLRRSVRARFV
jgi:methionyl-tRNA formyltransferase